MSLKDKRFAAKPREERIAVPEWDGAEVIVRGMTGAQRAKFAELSKSGSIANATAHLVIVGVIDPETGQPVYCEADRDEILKLAGEFTERIGRAVLNLSGFEKVISEVEKNSNATLND